MLRTPAPTPTILVIEGDIDVRRQVRHSLELEGYLVLEAGDGEEGLRMIAEGAHAVDLVLTDIEMPRIDGILVAKVLSQMRPDNVIRMAGGRGDTMLERVDLPLPPVLARQAASTRHRLRARAALLGGPLTTSRTSPGGSDSM